ncbi:uncharacterized protein LOC106378242 [Brassica napus]|uniref:uncharacterized protein LOC106378242 n=1 Tax=Brassica napus TaxID=3708 RepID=UPI0020788B7A|nr:uncharacterized protein LOC106378242 [Brassica napus]
MNAAKSEIFFGGFNSIEASVISDLSGFKIGTFPTRFLGLPLNPSRISMATLQPFIEKITLKLNSWTVKSLSFAGKVILVASGVYGMVNFKSSVFALPKRFYEKVDSLCSGFLWKNSTSSAAGARGQGHYGWLASTLKCLEDRVFWVTADAQRFSPTVRSLLRTKEAAAEFLRCSIGDGKTARFWHDYLTDLGPLIDGFGQRGPRKLRIAEDAAVSDAVCDEEWRLPPARSEEAVTLHIVLTTMAPLSTQ